VLETHRPKEEARAPGTGGAGTVEKSSPITAATRQLAGIHMTELVTRAIPVSAMRDLACSPTVRGPPDTDKRLITATATMAVAIGVEERDAATEGTEVAGTTTTCHQSRPGRHRRKKAA